MGVGIAVPSSAIYIAEISSPDLRGSLTICKLLLNFGLNSQPSQPTLQTLTLDGDENDDNFDILPHQGKLSSLPATFQALGVLLSYAIGLALQWHQLAWCSYHLRRSLHH